MAEYRILKKGIRFAAEKGFFNCLSDKQYLQLIYWARMGRKLHLDNPQSFNEKIQWLKLYDRQDIYTSLVDKYEAKKIVTNIIGEEHIIPTLGLWDNVDDIDFENLPRQFVLKTTHDSGSIVFCKDKEKFDIRKAKKKLTKALKRNYYLHGREWPYKNVKPRIIAEPYMIDDVNGELRDYKFFCFDGSAKAMYIASDRQKKGEETKFDFFDMSFTHLPFTNGHPNSEKIIECPDTFEEMRQIAEKLSKNIPHVRVDFYEINKKIYFSELTFSHWSGLVPFIPETWDNIFGGWINLASVKK